MHHSHITMDCYWTYLTLWFDILNITQLIMSSPGSIVTWCPMKKSTSTSPSISLIAIPQKAHNSMLQNAQSCSRIPEACIVILPMGLVIRHFIFLIPNTSNTVRSAGLCGPSSGAVCTAMWTFPTQSELLSVSVSIRSSVCRFGMCCLQNPNRPTRHCVSFCCGYKYKMWQFSFTLE